MTFLRPPGALPEEEFLKACVHCGQCAEVCTYGSIRISALWGRERQTPYIEPRDVPCWLCMKCPPVCPSGALQMISDPEKVRIGKARISKERCLNWVEDGVMCSTCYDRCPLRGKGMVMANGYIPTVAEGCSGCGACAHVCPVHAITIDPGVRPLMPEDEKNPAGDDAPSAGAASGESA